MATDQTTIPNLTSYDRGARRMLAETLRLINSNGKFSLDTVRGREVRQLLIRLGAVQWIQPTAQHGPSFATKTDTTFWMQGMRVGVQARIALTLDGVVLQAMLRVGARGRLPPALGCFGIWASIALLAFSHWLGRPSETVGRDLVGSTERWHLLVGAMRDAALIEVPDHPDNLLTVRGRQLGRQLGLLG